MLKPDTQLAQFKIIRKLGEGGMGSVYLAEDQKLHRQVALKTLSPEMFDNVEHQERFVREARTAAQISHGNVMAIYDIGATADADTGRTVQFIVMEYVKGQSLTNYLKGTKADLHAIIRLTEKIASGLAAAHKLRIVHRDIKTDNIIIDEQGEPKILDFGLAKPLEPLQMDGAETANTVSQELTRAGKIMGTVTYMSPEQIKGEPVDTRSDIFSFGILLYRMVTGEAPFGGSTQVSTLAKILETVPEPPRARNAEIPAELERIIDKCLQKDPNDRYQDTRDLVVDIRNLRKSYDSGTTETISVRTAAIPAKKSFNLGLNLSWKVMVVVLFGMVLLFAVIMELIGGSSRSARGSAVWAGENGIAILSFENRTGDTSLNWLGTGLPEILLTDLVQNRSVRVISRQRLLDAIETNGGTPNDEELRRAAVDLGAVNLLTGTYFKLGDQVRIDARVEEIGSGKILLAEKVVGADPFKLVDSLSQKVRAALNIESPGSSSAGVAQVTSSSPEAYKHYLAGMQTFGRSEYDSSIVEFEQALQIDSTLALAYMRIGMAYTFSGKQQKGARYFARARQYQDRLPVRERSMVDVYANIWLDLQIGDAATKLKQMAANYPDDKEIRTIYGVFLAQLDRDTTAGFAQFDTALQLDPTYTFALEVYGQIYGMFQQYDRALEIMRRLSQTLPGSAQPHNQMAHYLARMDRYDAAVAEYDKARAMNPNDADVIEAEFYLRLRFQNTDRAAALLELLKNVAGNDSFRLLKYHEASADLNGWLGRFQDMMRSTHDALIQAVRTKDDALVFEEFSSLVAKFERFDWKDSVRLYAARADSVAGPFQKLSYPMTLVDLDPANEATARPLLAKRLNDFRERVPASIWPQADGLQLIFDAAAKSDTTAMIAAYRSLAKAVGQPVAGNALEIGILLTLSGKFAEGKAELVALLSGVLRTANPLTYLQASYYLGRAEEGLGNKQSAIQYYQQVVKYWGGADIQTKEIKEAQDRLAKLTG
jgi:serine/threonine protein kinase/tetratricopeptide (TPR) repeat protein/TolB-like protein